jgi:nucleoside-diphosphate-sugar epimerase
MSNLVFITGGSGHIGSRVIVDALETGYSVRAAVRSQEKADKILSMHPVKSLNPGEKLDFVIVPDLLMDGAYDKALKGATYAIHVASPISEAHKEGMSFETTFIDPAVKGTLNILEAAKKSGSVRRVVITSSILGITSYKDHVTPGDTIFNEKSRTTSYPEPYADASEAYAVGKAKALNETEAWMEREKASITFDVVNIFPGFVIGRDELMTDASDAFRGTNKVILGPIKGLDWGSVSGCSVHVCDVAMAHIKSLDSKIPGNQGFLLVSEGVKGTHWENMFEIVAQHFPDAVKAGTLSNNGKIKSIPAKYDASETEKALGFKHRDFKSQVIDVVDHYLELVAASQQG